MTRTRLRAALLVCAGVLLLSACEDLPGKPTRAERYERPAKVTAFVDLYGENCAGCHGADGTLGPARPLNDPLYLALASDADLTAVTANGVAGTTMPAFSIDAGGFLDDDQIATLVREMRARWARPRDVAGIALPPYAAPPGDAERGAQAWATYCASCHGAEGEGGKVRGSVVDGAYLALVSDQGLRSTVIAGRPDLGMPDFRGTKGAAPMSEQQIADVVAWLAARRAQYPGRPFPRSN